MMIPNIPKEIQDDIIREMSKSIRSNDKYEGDVFKKPEETCQQKRAADAEQ